MTSFFFRRMLLLLLISNEIFATEIELKDGNRFLGNFISEDERSVLFKFQDKDYRIPKSEIVKFDKNKTGNDFSIGLSRVTLKDKSQIIGYLVEEGQDNLVLQSQLGFVNVEKSKIYESELNREKNFALPKKYLVATQESLNTFIGIGYGIYCTDTVFALHNPLT